MLPQLAIQSIICDLAWFCASLSATLAFDYPTPQAIAQMLFEQPMFQNKTTETTSTRENDRRPAPFGWIAYYDALMAQNPSGREYLEVVSQSRHMEEQVIGYTLPKAGNLRNISKPGKPAIILVPSFSPYGVLEYTQLIPHIEDDWTLYNLSHPGLGQGESLLNIEALINYHALSIREMNLCGSITLVGRSAGGWVANAVAALLKAQEPSYNVAVAMLDSLPIDDTCSLYAELFNEALEYGALATLEQRTSFDAFSMSAFSWYNAQKNGFSHFLPLSSGQEVPTLFLRAATMTQGIRRAAAQDPSIQTADMGWNRYCSSFSAAEVPGDHFTMLDEPMVTTLAATLKEWLHR